MNCYVDRIDEGFAVVIFDENELTIPLSVLPQGVKEGSCMTITFNIDETNEKNVKNEIKNLIGEIGDDSGCDFEL